MCGNDLDIRSLLLAACLAATAAAAPSGQTFKSSVAVQTVDAVVLDGLGNPVADLQSSDFSVRIAGRPRRVVQVERAFTETPVRQQFDTTRGSAASADRITAPIPRTVAVFIDDESSGAGGAQVLTRLGADIIRRAPDAMHFAAGSVWQDSYVSADRQVILDRLSGVRGMGDHPADMGRMGAAQCAKLEVIGTAEAVDYLERRSDEAFSSIAKRAGCGVTCVGEPDERICTQDVRAHLQVVGISATFASSRQTRSLLAFLRGLGALPGIKHVAILTRGTIVAGGSLRWAEFHRAAAAAGAVLHLIYDEPPMFDASARGLQPKRQEDIREAEGGVQNIASAIDASFHRLTGTGTNIVERIVRGMTASYRVTFELEPADLTKESLEIEVRTSRRNTEVRSARRVVPAPPKRPSVPTEEHLDMLLSGRDLQQTLRVAAKTYVALDSEGRGIRLALAAEVSTPDAVAVKYILSRVDGQPVTGRIARELKPRDGGRIVQMLSTEIIPPGDYVLRLAAVTHDAAGSLEYRFRARLNTAGDVVFSDPLLLPAGTNWPGATDALPTTGAVQGVVEFYPSGATPPAPFSVRFEVLDRPDGAPLAQNLTRVPFGDSRLASLDVSLSLAGLPAGTYIFRLVVEDAAGVRRAEWRRPLQLRASDPASPSAAPVPGRPAAPSAGGAPAPVLASATTVALKALPASALLDSEVVKWIVEELIRRDGGLKGAAVAQAAALISGTDLPATARAASPAEALQLDLLAALGAIRAGRYDVGLAAARRALKGAANFSVPAYLQGLAHFGSGREQEAVASWQMATLLEPPLPAAYRELTIVHLRNGRSAEAAELAGEGEERSKDAPAVRTARALIEAAAGRPEGVVNLGAGSGPADIFAVIRVAALHDAALGTPAGSPRWTAFELAAQQLTTTPGALAALVKEWLSRAPR